MRVVDPGVRALLAIGAFVLLGLLASWLFPATFDCKRVCCGKTERDLRSIQSAIEEYAADHSGRYPDSLEDLLDKDDRAEVYLKGTRVPRDRWGNEYQYSPIRRVVFTLGRDGCPGGEGDDADIDSLSLRDER